jgi:Flp pilus assembly protein TadD/peroxiredoxin
MLLKSMGLAPFALHCAPFYGSSLLGNPLFDSMTAAPDRTGGFPFADTRFRPHYPSKGPLEDVLRLVAPGSDDYVTERYAFELDALLKQWRAALKASTKDHATLAGLVSPSLVASSFVIAKETNLRSGPAVNTAKRNFDGHVLTGQESFLKAFAAWLGPVTSIATAEFEITDIEVIKDSPITVRTAIRYDLVMTLSGARREERVGSWRMEWVRGHEAASWQATRWEASEEVLSSTAGPGFVDVTEAAFKNTESYKEQLLRGSDHWRTVLDGACGIDVYGNNGVAAGDFDSDGFDDLYVCQPAGLPNRLYRNRGDGTFEDVTDKAGVGVLDNTACALFADFRNNGLQDLLVVCGTGPLLFLNQGDGTFKIKHDAFKFATAPEGSFTHAALIDYDRDGRLDIYFCLYSYYLGLDQYHYPVPYFDARNGPPNFLLHNEGDGTFTDKTEAAGLNVDNNRYSFACAWGESNANGLPDLYVANDFGRNSFYRNNGNGTFTSSATASHVEDVGAGMSACWSDFNNDGKPDLYAANMWSAAGQRVSGQKQFQQNAPESVRELYRRHAHGNTLYRNEGDGTFQNASRQAGVENGRWAWCSDFWDFDHDGYSDLYVSNGYITAPERPFAKDDTALAHADLGSFFWRQVVAKSPQDSTPSPAYEHGWNALNELIRSDSSWSGSERNVMFVNNRDGTFSEASGTLGLDFPEDGRSFALADLDHDGRLEIILKNRNAPQLRVLHNELQDLGHSIVFRLRGTQSNRDAIGAAITVEAGALTQTRYLQAGSGFLAQHSKELVFGIGKAEGPARATVRWPNGLSQVFEGLPVNQRIEIVEGSAKFNAKPFAPSGTMRTAAQPVPEAPPVGLSTWLIEPLQAPDFSLQDANGNLQSLHAFEGSLVLLNLWAVAMPSSVAQLKSFRQQQTRLGAAQVKIVAMNIDQAEDRAKAKAAAAELRASFPVVFSTDETAGIYNIIYRYLYDRRRDLAIPTSFLLDKQRMIVKIYQGALDVDELIQDAKSIPTTTSERIRKALPFHGTLYQGSFQRNDFTYGVAMFQHGYLEQAAASFQQVVAAKPDSAEGFYNLGTLELRRNNFAEARSYLQQTLKLRPNYPEAWNNLGMMAAQQGNPEEAIQDFQQSLQQRPGYAIALLNLGNVYRRQKDFAKAQEALTHALELQPDDPEIQYSLGMFYAQQSQMEQAETYLQRAIALRPDYPEALNNLGVLFVRAQDYARAEEEFKTCIRLTPNFDQSYINLARLYAIQHDKEKARASLQQLLRLQPENNNAIQAMDMLNAMP